MDVSNRKLFANREARSKLAQSAGIMASSAPLLQTVQRFQQGGYVGPVLQDPAFMALASRRGMTAQELFNTLDPAAQQAQVRRVERLRMMNFEPLGMGMEFPSQEDLDRRFQEEVLGLGASRPMTAPPASEAPMVPAPGSRFTGAADMSPALPVPLDNRGFYAAEPVPAELPDLAESWRTTGQKWGEVLAPIESLLERAHLPPSPDFSEEGEDMRRRAALRSERASADAAAPPEPVRDPGPLAERAALTFGETGDINAAANEMLRLHMGTTDGGDGQKDPAEMTVKERTNQLLEMYKDLFGDDDKDIANEKALTMAMVGFAIASGTSPNALENIAAGLLTGTKLMAENRGSRREREDRLKVLAMESALEEDRAEKARDAALEDYEEKLRLQVKYGVGEGASRDTQQNENLTQIWSSTYAERVGLGDSPDQAAEAAALAVEAARAQFPSVYGTVESGADLTKLRLEQAKKVLREGAPRSAVESILRLEGIDPGLLDG